MSDAGCQGCIIDHKCEVIEIKCSNCDKHLLFSNCKEIVNHHVACKYGKLLKLLKEAEEADIKSIYTPHIQGAEYYMLIEIIKEYRNIQQ